MHILLFIVIGLLSGLVVGMLGTGSSMIILPFLSYFYPKIGMSSDFAIHSAVGTCMAILWVGSVVAFYFKLKQVGKLDWSVVKWLIPGAMIGALAGAIIAHFLSGEFLRIYVGIFILAAGLHMLFKRDHLEEMKLPSSWILLIVSMIAACLSGMAGIAIGILLVPFLRKCNVPINQAILIAIFIAVIYTFVGTLGFVVTGLHVKNMPHWSLGYVYLPAMLAIAFFTALAVPVGVKFSSHVSHKALHYGFGIFVVLAGTNLLFRII